MTHDDHAARLGLGRLGRRELLRGAAIGAAGLTAAALIGCGGDDDDDAAAPPAAAAPAAATAAAATAAAATAAAATAAAAPPTQAAASSSDRPFWLEPTARLDGKRGGIFRGTLSRPLASLDPMTTRDPTTKALSAGVYGGLVGVIGSTFANQPVLGVQPDLADSWEIQPDGLKYTFHIRPDAMITEPINRPMDSGDVLYSFNHHQGLDGLEPAPERGQFAAAIGDWDAVDASSFVINMIRPQASFMNRLADIFTITMMPVESRPGGSFDPANTMIGYGPFILESADADTGYTLKRNPNWWQAKVLGLDIPWFDGVEATVIPSSANRLVQLKSGNVDYAGNQDPNSLPELQEEVGDALKIWPYKALGWGFLAFGDPRDGSAPWADARVRRAISLALDRDSLDEVVYNTSKLDAAGFEVSPKLSRHGALPAGWPGQSIDPREDPKIGEFIRFDVTEAMKLMDAAGFGGGFDMPYHYTNVYPGNWGLEGELIQQMIGKIGINLTGGVEDFRAVYTPRTQNGDFDGLGWILSAIPTFVDYLEYFNPDSNDNKSKLNEPAVWAKAEEVLQIVDPEESAQAMQDIQRDMLIDLMWYVPGVAWQLQWRAGSGNLQNTEEFLWSRGGPYKFRQPYQFFDPPQA